MSMTPATRRTLMLAQAHAALITARPTLDPDKAWRDLMARQRRDSGEAMRRANPKKPSVRAKKRQARREAWK